MPATSSTGPLNGFLQGRQKMCKTTGWSALSAAISASFRPGRPARHRVTTVLLVLGLIPSLAGCADSDRDAFTSGMVNGAGQGLVQGFAPLILLAAPVWLPIVLLTRNDTSGTSKDAPIPSNPITSTMSPPTPTPGVSQPITSTPAPPASASSHPRIGPV